MSEEQRLANFQELMELVLKHQEYFYLWKGEGVSGEYCVTNESFAFKEEKPCSPKDESYWLF